MKVRAVVTDIDEAAIEKVAAEINHRGGKCICIRHDVSSESEWNKVINRTLDQFGRLDVLSTTPV